VLTEENHAGVLSRAEGMSQEEAQLLAVEYRPKPIPRDVVRVSPAPLVTRDIAQASPLAPLVPSALVPAETGGPSRPPEIVKPLTTELRRLNVTVSAEFIDELEQVRVALSHKCPDGNFEQVVREAFKLVLERDRKRKALTDRPRAPTDQSRALTDPPCAPADQPRALTDRPPAPTDRPRAHSKISGESGRCENDRYVPAAVKRAVWERDGGRCTWPMGDGQLCGSARRLEFDHDLEVALGGRSTVGNLRLLCRGHNLMKAEQRLGRAFMARFKKNRLAERDTS
jgi:hypothetical protein